MDFRALVRAEREKAQAQARARARTEGDNNNTNGTLTSSSSSCKDSARKNPASSKGAINATDDISGKNLPRLVQKIEFDAGSCAKPSFPLPNGLRIYTDFLSSDTANDILSHVRLHESGWHELKHAQRRVKMVDARGDAGVSAPAYLSILFDALKRDIFPPDHPPNHVLINEYSPTQGIMPHTDGPSYFPLTCTVSLGAPAVVTFQERLKTGEIGMREAAHVLDAYLAPGSLLVFSQDYYTRMLHSISAHSATISGKTFNAIPGTTYRRGNRWSLTIRHKYVEESSS